MQARDDQLCRHKEQDHRGNAKEFLQIDSDAAFYEHHAERNRNQHTQQRSKKTEQFGGIQRHRAQDQNRLYALAQHHQEHEQEQAEPGILARK